MTQVAEKPLLHSPREAAALLSISTRTCWRMIARGELPIQRIGRSVRIPRSAIEKYAGSAA
ncbi:MAG: helix-turn-helix domain-containing protein [Gammaproteobacteria bacterium]